MASKEKLHRRNPLHNHPLLFKGGVHRKSNKSKRRMDKVKIKKEWLPQSIFLRVYFGEVIHLLFSLRVSKSRQINRNNSVLAVFSYCLQ